MTKREIIDTLGSKRLDNSASAEKLTDSVTLDKYSPLVHDDIWTQALQAALNEHEVVVIPARDEPYMIDSTVVIPSNRSVRAYGATLRLTPDCDVIMFRNSSTEDGTHKPVTGAPDHNISFFGGRYEESRRERGGYGTSGKYDEKRSFHGVSTLFFFNNIKGFTIEDATFAHTAGFAVQTGDAENIVFEHIRFEECYADGLHINGNTANILCRDIKGQVGDDLVALNVYDWQNSSVDFGPMKNVLCEDLELSADSRYKAMRIEPGRYIYDDGSIAECSLTNALIRNVRGIMTFKLYYQTPPYRTGTAPERGMVGRIDDIYFEDITIDLDGPLDRFPEYLDSDPVRGRFAAFEFGADAGRVSFENIDLRLYPEKYPLSTLALVGPKSVRRGETEIFDPYVSCEVGELSFHNIRINGRPAELPELFAVNEFGDINADGHSGGQGKVKAVTYKKT